MTRLFAIFVILVSSVASAHEGHHDVDETFQRWDLVEVGVVLLAAIYLRGLTKFHGRSPLRSVQIVSFFSGVTVLALVNLPSFDSLADRLFSLHMIQHLAITSLAAPLITLGSPMIVLVRALPHRMRAGFSKYFSRPEVWRCRRSLARPLVALVIYEGVFTIWHVPVFYDLALENSFTHLAEHFCLFASAMVLWNVIIEAPPSIARIAGPKKIALLVSLLLLDSGLGAALTYSNHVWYAYGTIAEPAGWALSRLDDQRLGGLLMWVPGSLVWLTALGVLFTHWMRETTHSAVSPNSAAPAAAV